MITKEDYLKALDVVEAYHLQLQPKIANARRKYKGWDELKVGDNVECVLVHLQNRKCLTKGRKYEVCEICKHSFGHIGFSFYIKDDNWKSKHYAKTNSQFKACV